MTEVHLHIKDSYLYPITPLQLKPLMSPPQILVYLGHLGHKI